MLSKKMAFSLMSLITIFALAFAVPSVMAADEITPTLSADTTAYGEIITVTIAFDKVVGIANVNAKKPTVMTVTAAGATAVPTAATGTTIDATSGAVTVNVKDTDSVVPGIQTDDKIFEFKLAAITAPTPTQVAAGTDIRRIFVTLPTAVAALDPASTESSKAAGLIINLTAVSAVTVDTPRVVSIQRLRPSTQTVTSAFEEAEVTGALDVRIVFTEKPYDFKLATINVEGGTASNLVVGVPFTWYGGRNADGTRNAAETLRPHPIEGMYAHSGTGALQGVPSGSDRVTVPLPSGADDMYHQYRVTVTPYQGVGMVKISIKEFHDNALPFLNVYTPINVEHKPNGREQLRLAVSTTTTALGTSANVAVTTEATAEAENAIAEITKATPDAAATAAEAVIAEVTDTSVIIPEEGQIYISEIMFARGKHGTLPQWIEISNGSRTEEVNLSGWTLTVNNVTTDTDVSVGAKAVFTIPEGTRIDASGQHDTPSTVLVVTEQGRNNLSGAMAAGQMVNLWTDQQTELIRLDIFNRRYSLLSDMAFKITLAPPEPDVDAMKRKMATDVVGNLADDGTAAWALPMNEEGVRSSIIRRHVSAEPKDGTMMESWVLASDTNLAMDLSARSYYGLPIDIGTPGFRAGGALPVELSHFRPERQKDTGAVVITWSTQSELNNAGFFVKRSQQRDGQFKVINATMIPGAGTTSEKQFYTYTDTTAQPNVVYYQIEDVSFDGNRQTLTRGIRLKGHVGAAGKATTTWGELKISSEL